MNTPSVPDPADADDRQRAARLRLQLTGWQGVSPDAVRVVRSPYRACPVGAHVDHQLGCVTGMALDRCILMAFAPRDDGLVVLRSEGFTGDVSFGIRSVPAEPAGDWADYARGAVLALAGHSEVRTGMTGLISGYGNCGGLSSSAAVGVAYLLALECVNDISADATENVELDRRIENDYIGVNNGVLDQSIILRSLAGHLTFLDCRDARLELVPFGGDQEPVLLVLFSGLTTPLCDTDYNLRVGECGEAAARLLALSGMPEAPDPVLRLVPREMFEKYGDRLPKRLQRRAAHFFGEQERVACAVDMWRAGDLEGFGRLVGESGRSSVENYECGNPYLRDAFEVLDTADGVYGARFSGAGFRGCCIGLCDPAAAGEAAAEALRAYKARRPEMEDAEAFVCRSADAACFLD